MHTLTGYPCPRCGQERIVTKTWKEMIQTYGGLSAVTHTDTVCPDTACQKIVEAELAVQREKRATIRRNHDERILALRRKKK